MSIPHKQRKLQERKKACQEMASRLYDVMIGDVHVFEGRAMRMMACSDVITVGRCEDCGSVQIVTSGRCRDRLCPICQHKLALERTGELIAVYNELVARNEYFGSGMITLTVRNVELDRVGETVDSLAAGWHRLCNRQQIKRGFAGWARSIEITYNKERNDYHVHIHVFILFPKNYFSDPKKYVHFDNLREMFKESCRLSYDPVVRIQAAYTKKEQNPADAIAAVSAAAEAIKYIVKSNDIAHLRLGDLMTFAQQIKGRRFMAFGGNIIAIRKALGFTVREQQEEKEEYSIDCSHCGGQLMHQVLSWSGAEYQPLSGASGA